MMGELHWNQKSRTDLTILVVLTLATLSNAGPMKRSIRTVREVYPPDIEPEIEGNQAQVCIVGETIYEVDDVVPAEQPCLKCRCQPPMVQCETVQCVKRPGCKAIHRPNRCCPDYQCECEHNGRIYANGEKLETNPGGECKVCYCRGGEIQCAEVSCYIRNDCEGKRVPGKCCHKYDHCPPIDSVPERLALITEAPIASPKSAIDCSDAINLINSTHPPMTTTSYSIIADENRVPDTDINNLDASKLEFDEIPKADGMLPRITIQEIIPERKEIPITASPKLEEPQGTLLIEEAIAPSERMDDLSIPDSDPESSEIAEVFHHPPPVLRIGDKLLFLKKGEFVEKDSFSTPQSVITIIGAEGLQRGFEESFEIPDGKFVADNIDTNAADTNELELKTAESTHILSLVRRKQKAQVSTTTENINETNKQDVTTVTIGSVDIPMQNTEKNNLTTEAIMVPESPSSEQLPQNPTQITSATSTEQLFHKVTEPIQEQNPAYPPIPDIMPAVGDVSQKFEVELESDNETMKILPGVFELLDNSTQDEHKNISSHSEWLKANQTYIINTDTLINYNASLPRDLLNAKSPIDDLEYSTETDGMITATIAAPIKELESSSGSSLEKTTQHVMSKIASTEESKFKEIIDIFDSTTEVDRQVVEEHQQNRNIHFEQETELTKSIESLEHKDSGEQTTQKPSHSAIMTPDENASIFSEKETSEANDMINRTPKKSEEIPDQVDSDKVEATTKSLLSDVEVIVPMTSYPVSDKESPASSVPSIPVSDVEMITEVTLIKMIKNSSAQKNINSIGVEGLPKPTAISKVESSTYELLPMPQHASDKIIKKRDIGLNLGFDDASIEVFPKPQIVDPGKKKEQPKEKEQHSKKNDLEEQKAQEVFKELLDELSTEQNVRQQRSRNGQDALDGLTGALTSFALGGGRETKNTQSNSGGVFGFIGNIFSPNRGRN